MTLFSAENITKTFDTGSAVITVLQNLSLTIEAGEMIAVIGASGSGKTTLLQILGTLAEPTEGELYFNGESLNEKSPLELAEFRNKSLGFIFQFHHLLPDFTALENVMMPALIAGQKRKDMSLPAKKLLERMELDHRLEHKVSELSGGEQQRTALARALIMNPALLLADEPTGNLDSRAGDLVFDLLHTLCRERGLATIMVTHNNRLADRLDHCYTLKDGVLELE
ncbi:MAG: ABC transporter ATP-binding protein [Desulfobulbaceae bacterium S5133MH15]|nr:MAG: ABC transporter ATP-binding protein [Desulfobulbaceae bacterium S5133MH15]OEU82725.1 MAG: ABC transporter ATP-binding protein [Desulfobulbaceae bacterium C00003063]